MRAYADPPIKEAVLYFRIDPGPQEGPAVLDRITQRIGQDYPSKQTQRKRELFINLEGDQRLVQTTHKIVGFRFRSEDEKRSLQCTLDSFAFSRLSPYRSWRDLNGESRRLWDVYRDVVNPLSVKRVGLKYINLIKIPRRSFELEDYFTGVPNPPPTLPQNVTGFELRLAFGFCHPAQAFCHLATQPTDAKDSTTIVFEIEVFQDCALDPGDARIWEILDSFRTTKNDLFRAYITEKTEELFG